MAQISAMHFTRSSETALGVLASLDTCCRHQRRVKIILPMDASPVKLVTLSDTDSGAGLYWNRVTLFATSSKAASLAKLISLSAAQPQLSRYSTSSVLAMWLKCLTFPYLVLVENRSSVPDLIATIAPNGGLEDRSSWFASCCVKVTKDAVVGWTFWTMHKALNMHWLARFSMSRMKSLLTWLWKDCSRFSEESWLFFESPDLERAFSSAVIQVQQLFAYRALRIA
mmetsp:Transcript_20645/g.30255  ORF Transcript_20645/g.30255 Transcript_20645/m.30255 type:complete len:226 (-) Transcript_20645:176-853(-)